MKQNNQFYKFLNNKEVSEKIIDFNHENITKVHFFIPSIHCSSCILILENLPKIQKGIFDSTVDFVNKKIWITFNNENLKLSDLATILDKMGYKPNVNWEFFEKKKRK